MNTIIVPTDFSEEAQHALDFAIGFNQFYQGNIILLHVMDVHESHRDNVKLHDEDNLEDLFTPEDIEAVTEKLMQLMEQ